MEGSTMKQFLLYSFFASLMLMSLNNLADSYGGYEDTHETWGCEGVWPENVSGQTLGVNCFFLMGTVGDKEDFEPSVPQENWGIITQNREVVIPSLPKEGAMRYFAYTPATGELAQKEIELVAWSKPVDDDLRVKSKLDNPQSNVVWFRRVKKNREGNWTEVYRSVSTIPAQKRGSKLTVQPDGFISNQDIDASGQPQGKFRMPTGIARLG